MEDTEIPKTPEVPEKTDSEKRKEEYETLKAENDKVEEELIKREQLRAKVALGGKSAAGAETVEKTQDQKDEEAAKDFMQDDE